ncbi:MAG: energy transducer TonB [Candidatus Sulfotelmatobacter sp.]
MSQAGADKRWKINDKLAFLGLLVAILIGAATIAAPEVRRWVGLDQHEQAPPKAQPSPPKQDEPAKPRSGEPHLQYVPLPNTAPLKIPSTLVTAIPKGETQPKTVEINGEQIPVITQAEVDRILTHKVDLQQFGLTSSYRAPVDVWVTIGKDGTVQEVENAGGNKPLSDEFKAAVKQWRFQPFVMNGRPVAVQTVIQLDGSSAEKH